MPYSRLRSPAWDHWSSLRCATALAGCRLLPGKSNRMAASRDGAMPWVGTSAGWSSPTGPRGRAVNKFGDACFVYGQTGVTTKQPLFPEVRYSIWFHDEAQQRRSRLLQAGTFQPTWHYDPDDKGPLPPETVATSVTHAYQLDYATAVVDPVDDVTFWMIHEYADDTSKSWKTVVGVVNPTA